TVALRGGPRQQRRQLVAVLDQRRGEEERAVADPRQDALTLREATERVDRHRRPDDRGEIGQRGHRAPDLLEHQAGLEETQAASAHVLGERHAEESGVGQPLPFVGADAVVGGLDRAQPLARQRFAQDLQRQVGDRALIVVELEIHVVPQCRGTRGIPRPKSAIRSRWTSFVPPPNVRKSVPWYARSRRPRSGASPEPRSIPAEPNTSSRSRYASQKNSVPNTLVALESAGLTDALVTAFQLIS